MGCWCVCEATGGAGSSQKIGPPDSRPLAPADRYGEMKAKHPIHNHIALSLICVLEDECCQIYFTIAQKTWTQKDDKNAN